MIFLLFLISGLLFICIVIVFFILITAIPAFLGAPFELTKIENVERMLKLAEPKENEILYDLGSGDDRIIIEAVKKYKVEAVGIEINPLLVFISRKKN